MRRLLADGVPTRRMPELVTGSGNEELKGMILGGVEVVVRPGEEREKNAKDSSGGSQASPERWTRLQVMAGIELHLREGRQLSPAEVKRVMEDGFLLLR